MENLLQLSNTEEQMLLEVFNVMSKYKGITRSFGVQLIHSHFTVKPDEVLYETHDVKTRKLFIEPVNSDVFLRPPLATAWQQNESGELVVSMFCCDSSTRPSRR